MSPKPNNKRPYDKKKKRTQKRSPVKTEAETGGMRPRAQRRLEPPEAGRGGKDPPLEPLQGSAALPTPGSQTSGPQD